MLCNGIRISDYNLRTTRFQLKENKIIRCEIMAPLCVILVTKRSQDACIKISFASGDKGKDR